MLPVQMILRVGLRRLVATSIYKSYANNMNGVMKSECASELTHHSNAELLISKVPIIEIDGDAVQCRVCAKHRV